MKTRSRKTTTTKGPASQTEQHDEKPNTLKQLAPSVERPPHVFILPKGASPEARIISLPTPASSSPSRYFICPEKGFYEFTQITTAKKACKSWLLAPPHDAPVGNAKDESTEDGVTQQQDEGYVLSKPDMFIATPVDPLFVLLPLLANGETGSYLTFSDYVYTTENQDLAQLQQLLRQSTFIKLEKIMEQRMEAMCDCLDMGDGEDKMYQLSTPKLVAELASKAKNMAKNGLPAAMEERFVKQTLEVPVLSIKREDSSISIAADDATPEAFTGNTPNATSEETSQATSTSTTPADSQTTAATSVTSTPPNDKANASDETLSLLRIRTALDFLTVSYVPENMRASVQDALKSPTSPVDFTPLTKHLDQIADLKKQAQALRSLSDNISRKRGPDDDEDAMDKAEAKRKKKEEDEIKKKNTSRGVQQLAKANTSGMKKLSSFFTKAPPKKT
ncbi:hypothetical protein Q7P37_010155 [Cladosporium fusiforme]